MKAILIFLFALLFTNCSKQPEIVAASENPSNESIQEIASTSVKVNNQPAIASVTEKKKNNGSMIEGTRGMLVLDDGYDKPNDFLKFYNEDGSLWHQFTFYYDDSDGKFEYENNAFRPYAFHPDYFLLALKYVSEDTDRFKVIVNEETGLKKYVKKGDKNLKFEAWEEHILKTFAIKFNETKNPLRESPNGKIKKVGYSKIERFDAVEFKGEWLKVEWDIESNSKDEPSKADSGWIKWKKGGKLLIELFHLC